MRSCPTDKLDEVKTLKNLAKNFTFPYFPPIVKAKLKELVEAKMAANEKISYSKLAKTLLESYLEQCIAMPSLEKFSALFEYLKKPITEQTIKLPFSKLGKQCRDQWHNRVQPGLCPAIAWTAVDSKYLATLILSESIRKSGKFSYALAHKQWKAKHPGRYFSENTIKNKLYNFKTARSQASSLFRQYLREQHLSEEQLSAMGLAGFRPSEDRASGCSEVGTISLGKRRRAEGDSNPERVRRENPAPTLARRIDLPTAPPLAAAPLPEPFPVAGGPVSPLAAELLNAMLPFNDDIVLGLPDAFILSAPLESDRADDSVMPPAPPPLREGLASPLDLALPAGLADEPPLLPDMALWSPSLFGNPRDKARTAEADSALEAGPHHL